MHIKRPAESGVFFERDYLNGIYVLQLLFLKYLRIHLKDFMAEMLLWFLMVYLIVVLMNSYLRITVC